MRRVEVLAGAALVAGLLAGCAVPTGPLPPTAGGVIAPEVLAKASLKYYWQYRVGLDPGETLQRLWRLDENLYALTNVNRLIAMDAATGTYKWDYRVADPGQKVFAPCHADDLQLPGYDGIKVVLDPPTPEELSRIPAVPGVVINTLSHALLLDRRSGKLLRRLYFGFACNSSGSSDGIYLFVGSPRGWYYPVRLVDGLTPWTGGTDDMITARPVWHRRVLYVASRDGRFYALNPYVQLNRRLWAQQTDGPLTAEFHVDDRGCFVGGEDFNLYAFDRQDGTLLWTFRTQGSLREPVQVGKQTVFQYADRDRFYAIDMARGEKRWELLDGRFVLGVAEPYAYVLTDERKVRVVHEATGEERLAFPMTGLDLFVPNAAKPLLYAASRTGRFVCITPASMRHLTPKMLSD